jgi:hypothetical protein
MCLRGRQIHLAFVIIIVLVIVISRSCRERQPNGDNRMSKAQGTGCRSRTNHGSHGSHGSRQRRRHGAPATPDGGRQTNGGRRMRTGHEHRCPSSFRFQVSSLIPPVSAPCRGELPRARTLRHRALPRGLAVARPSICWLLDVGDWLLDVEFRCPVHPAPDPPVEDAVAVVKAPDGGITPGSFLAFADQSPLPLDRDLMIRCSRGR